MIAWVLMFLDLASFLVLSITHFNLGINTRFLFASAGYLMIKGIIFRDFMSIIDAMVGIYILIVFFFGISTFFYWVILFWFLYKLIFTIVFSMG